MYLEIGDHAIKHAQKVVCKKDFPSFYETDYKKANNESDGELTITN